MKKYLLWLIPVVLVLALAAGYLYLRYGTDKYQKAQTAVTPPGEKAGNEEEGGRGGRSGPVNMEIVIDGRTIRTVIPAE